MKQRVRIGVKIPIFVNAGIFVLHAEPAQAEKLQYYTEGVRAILRLNGNRPLAERFVCQVTEWKP